MSTNSQITTNGAQLIAGSIVIVIVIFNTLSY